jgi:RNA-directed DNA polymerase
MPREKRKWQQPRGERPDAEHWGGPTRKSEEGWECGGSKGVGSSGGMRRSTGNRRKLLRTTKPFTISKQLVSEAFKAVKAKAGAAGVDKQSIEDFEKDFRTICIKSGTEWRRGAISPRRSKRWR